MLRGRVEHQGSFGCLVNERLAQCEAELEIANEKDRVSECSLVARTQSPASPSLCCSKETQVIRLGFPPWRLQLLEPMEDIYIAPSMTRIKVIWDHLQLREPASGLHADSFALPG